MRVHKAAAAPQPPAAAAAAGGAACSADAYPAAAAAAAAAGLRTTTSSNSHPPQFNISRFCSATGCYWLLLLLLLLYVHDACITAMPLTVGSLSRLAAKQQQSHTKLFLSRLPRTAQCVRSCAYVYHVSCRLWKYERTNPNPNPNRNPNLRSLKKGAMSWLLRRGQLRGTNPRFLGIPKATAQPRSTLLQQMHYNRSTTPALHPLVL